MKKVLLIEDDFSLRENTAEILELSGYEVIMAPNGKIGADYAKAHRPNIIVCDIMMPEMDGYGVLQELSADDTTKHIPFIFLSAKTERSEIRKGMDLGADDYLTKPIDKSDLPNAVRKLLPEIKLDEGVLIVEEGTTLFDMLGQAQGEAPLDTRQTADLDEAIQWMAERKFGTILVGKHSEMDAVAQFMDSVKRSKDYGDTPMVLLNSIELESMDADQLLSFIRVHQNPDQPDNTG